MPPPKFHERASDRLGPSCMSAPYMIHGLLFRLLVVLLCLSVCTAQQRERVPRQFTIVPSSIFAGAADVCEYPDLASRMDECTSVASVGAAQVLLCLAQVTNMSGRKFCRSRKSCAPGKPHHPRGSPVAEGARSNLVGRFQSTGPPPNCREGVPDRCHSHRCCCCCCCCCCRCCWCVEETSESWIFT